MSILKHLKDPSLSESPSKMMKNLFISHWKAFFFSLFSKYLVLETKPDKKAKVIFKVYVTNWATNNYNIYIAKYLKKYM